MGALFQSFNSVHMPAPRRSRNRLSTANWPEGLFCNVAAKLSADHYRVPLSDISSKTRRSPSAALARQVAMYVAHVAFGVKIADVGVCFGRDRTTVSYACNRVEDWRDDAGFDDMLMKMETVAAIMRDLHNRQVIS